MGAKWQRGLIMGAILAVFVLGIAPSAAKATAEDGVTKDAANELITPNPWAVQIGYTIPLSTFIGALKN